MISVLGLDRHDRCIDRILKSHYSIDRARHQRKPLTLVQDTTIRCNLFKCKDNNELINTHNDCKLSITLENQF